ncbi:MAG TPA: SUMF1/EgtB/PvdO family nonheme iron enzyme [Isosphaeraceae bacterium]|nr:SUMF1/EgtB/PvdO family nonheme iron enzyme [Isosphaeraceae bacterium]
MSSQLTWTTEPSRGWASRLFGAFGARRTAGVRSGPSRPFDFNGGGPSSGEPRGADSHAAALRRIAEGRYAFVLSNETGENLDEALAVLAWETLEDQMALVPAGVVPVVRADGSVAPTPLGAFYLDRFAVTNGQFQRFVQSGCYDALEIWPREIWPGLMRFVDRTGRPSPRYWENGSFPRELSNHPVVGVCWYEAVAYARWVGKRLPSSAEWQKASGWPEHLSGGTCTRYPWGDLYAEGRANLWSSGLGRAAPVDAFPEGVTLNGVFQMSGNVWEWLDDPLESIPARPEESFRTWKPMRRIVGGAYDTYLPAEATNQFITGQPELDRRANIGFRCAVTVERLLQPKSPTEPPTRKADR